MATSTKRKAGRPRKNAQSNGSATPIDQAVQALDERKTRLKELAQQRKDVQKQLDQIDAEAEKLVTGSMPTRRGRQASGKTRTSTSKRSGKSRGRSRSGNSVDAIALRVLPGPDDEPMSKADFVTEVQKAGFESKSDKPEVVISQALSRLSSHSPSLADNPDRGHWRLTKAGVKERDRQAEEAKEKEQQEASTE